MLCNLPVRSSARRRVCFVASPRGSVFCIRVGGGHGSNVGGGAFLCAGTQLRWKTRISPLNRWLGFSSYEQVCERGDLVDMLKVLLSPPTQSAHTTRREDIKRERTFVIMPRITLKNQLNTIIPNHNSTTRALRVIPNLVEFPHPLALGMKFERML